MCMVDLEFYGPVRGVYGIFFVWYIRQCERFFSRKTVSIKLRVVLKY